MDIDLSLLHSSTVEVIDINNSYELTKDYYENTDIRELSSIDVVGQITRKENENNELNDYIECTIK